jgi:hypothetical protein
VKITHCGNTDPQGIIKEAIGLRNKFDRIFCVIDRDAHPKFDVALSRAKEFSNITVIASYPCFEFWLLLHFSCTRKPYRAIGSDSAADLLLRDLRKNPGMESYAKDGEQKIFTSLLGEKFIFASTNAPKVLLEALELGMNPSTYIHELLQHFQAYGKLELIEGE